MSIFIFPGEIAVIGPYVNGNPNQQWVIAGSRVQNRVNPAWVLTEDNANSKNLYTHRVIAGIYSYGTASQHWNVDIPYVVHLKLTSLQFSFFMHALIDEMLFGVKTSEIKIIHLNFIQFSNTYLCPHSLHISHCLIYFIRFAQSSANPFNSLNIALF